MSLSNVLNFTIEFGSNSGHPSLSLIFNNNSIDVFSNINWSLVNMVRDFSGVCLMVYILMRNFMRLPLLLDGNFTNVEIPDNGASGASFNDFGALSSDLHYMDMYEYGHDL